MDEKQILNRYGGQVVIITLQGHEIITATIREEWTYALIVDLIRHEYVDGKPFYYYGPEGYYIAKGVIRMINEEDVSLDDVHPARPVRDNDQPF